MVDVQQGDGLILETPGGRVVFIDRDNPERRVFAFDRTNFVIAHVRTDGHRVLAFTHSGRRFMNEAYRFTVFFTGQVEFARSVIKRSAPNRAK